MPYARTDDDVKLYYEEAGSGSLVLFVHEFAGDHRSWEPQMRALSRYFRVAAFAARGYPPSDVPADPGRYSQARARDDIIAVIDHLGVERAHIVGLSMGAFATLHVGLAAPQRALSLMIAGCGYGAAPGHADAFRSEVTAVADEFEARGMETTARRYTRGPARLPHEAKDPRGYAEFAQRMGEHSALGSANTIRGVQMRRPSLYELTDAMKAVDVPTLIVSGDEDDQCLEPGLLMKRSMPNAGLWILPRTGHTINLEEADAFNRGLLEFLLAVESGRWTAKPPAGSTLTLGDTRT